MKQELVFSGLQPTGMPHIGNYFGAIKQWVGLQKDHSCLFCVVDWHALTVEQDPKRLSQQTLDAAITLLAAGVDPKKAPLFIQSWVPEHTELSWIFSTVTPFGELHRMTQWKEKSNSLKSEERSQTLRELLNDIEEHSGYRSAAILAWLNSLDKFDKKKYAEEIAKNRNRYVHSKEFEIFARGVQLKYEGSSLDKVNAGLLNYPILMAADILLYKGTMVPVGEDQVQHVELARIIARKFNNRYGNTFPEPKPRLTKAMRIMSLTDSTKKMSKSHGEKSYIALTDDPDIIKQKLAKAVTATVGGGANPGVQNLLAIMHEVSTPETLAQFQEQENDGSIKYSELKAKLAVDLAEHLSPFREKYRELQKHPKDVLNILEDGRKKASAIAQKTMAEVRQKMGILAQ